MRGVTAAQVVQQVHLATGFAAPERKLEATAA
jgi:hypothetical protein